jgi:hypothetical protein
MIAVFHAKFHHRSFLIFKLFEYFDHSGARLGRVLLQAEVRAAPMIIVREFSEVSRQSGFTEYNHVIQALPTNGADHPLDKGSLPRRPWR